MFLTIALAPAPALLLAFRAILLLELLALVRLTLFLELLPIKELIGVVGGLCSQGAVRSPLKAWGPQIGC